MDLRITDKGDGGEAIETSSDLETILGVSNMPYLAMFGGNVEGSTPKKQTEGVENVDYWQNNLLTPNNIGAQMNSETEKALYENVLNSNGRIKIEEAAKKDLQALADYCDSNVTVTIKGPDRAEISVILKPKLGEQSIEHKFIYSATNADLDKTVNDTYKKEGINYWYVGSTFVIS